MNVRKLAQDVARTKGGVATTADFVAAGIRAADVVKLCEEGSLERVRHGYYSVAGSNCASEEQLLAALIPKAVVCMESALFHYGYSDFVPRMWSITIPRTMTRTKLNVNALMLRPYYASPDLYELGKTTGVFNGVVLPVYDRERTVCDCFKRRGELDREVFNKAVVAYVNDDDKNLANLSRYAKTLRVYKKVSELTEVLLNG